MTYYDAVATAFVVPPANFDGRRIIIANAPPSGFGTPTATDTERGRQTADSPINDCRQHYDADTSTFLHTVQYNSSTHKQLFAMCVCVHDFD